MIAELHVLAGGAEDLLELLPIILFVGIIGVIGAVQRKLTRKAQEAERRNAEQRRQEQATGRPYPDGYGREGEAGPAGARDRPAQAEPAPPGSPAGPPPPPPKPDLDLARQALQRMGVIFEEPPQRAPQAVQPAAPAPVEPQPVRVGEELERERRREGKLTAERRRRLAAPKVPEADTAEIESRLLGLRPAEMPGVDEPTGPSVDLSDIESARRAIIFHEIFSPPKSLRKGKEMWDV